MTDVLFVESVHRDADSLLGVVACVDGAVVSRASTYQDPEEYAAALCRGSFYVQDDEVIPEDHAELCEFVGDRVITWEVVDASDY